MGYADGRVTHNFHRPEQYMDCFNELDYEGIPMPMSLEDIRKFETRNNVAINVFCLNEKKDKVIPLQYTKVPKEKVLTDKIIKLLLIEENGNFHYTWIKNLDRLLHPKGFHSSGFHCPFCLSAIKKKEKLEEHVDCCRENEPAKATFPKNKNIKFKDQKNMLKAPITMYGDFESLLVKVNKTFGGKSEIKSEHKACGFSLVITSPYFPRREHQYRGENAERRFLEVLYEERNRCLDFIQKESHKKMHLTPEEEEAHKKATTCWICGEKGFTKTRKVASPQNKAEQKHLKILRPHLATCEMDIEKIPTIAEVMKNRKLQLNNNHPDKNSHLDEKKRKEKEEKCKKLVAAFRSIIDYFKKHNLSEVVVERDELDELLKDEEMP